MQKPNMVDSGNVSSGDVGGEPQHIINRLADKIDNLYQSSHEIREKILTSWDKTNQTCIPNEVLNHYKYMKNSTKIMISNDF